MRGHKNAHNDLSAKFIRTIFKYAPTTGMLFWKVTLSKRAPAGMRAGTLDDQGRIKIGIRGKEYFAHRIIWVLVTGKWPKFEIDHRNQIKSDNRWHNLREATSSQNHRNRGVPKNNQSGYKGVCYDNSKQAWLATINIKAKGRKRHIHIGWFSTAKKAAAAYKEAAIKIHGSAWANF
ncbi:MAG TPA: HNH endonuclease signature motif containing protein [Candidatus Acidoferrum sp.]|nr:HNH endonuclease signature motif containing protein [Candidatus Acidoferrum sp.]